MIMLSKKDLKYLHKAIKRKELIDPTYYRCFIENLRYIRRISKLNLVYSTCIIKRFLARPQV